MLTVLAGVLRSNSQLLDKFVNQVLSIEGDRFNVETQQKYDNSIIDMVFSNHETICFLENKVDSSEGAGQLQKYSTILAGLDCSKKVFLRYCTKYHDRKDSENFAPPLNTEFRQFRWSDISNFFKDNNNNLLTQLLITLLKDLNMSSIPEFNNDDLIAPNQFIGIALQKMDECLDRIKPKFTELFGEPISSNTQSQRLSFRFNRYAMYKRFHYPDDKRQFFEILVAFSWEEDKNLFIYVHLFCTEGHQNLKKYQETIINYRKENQYFKIKEFSDQSGYSTRFEKNISDFISSDNQYKKIEEWFIEHMEIFHNERFKPYLRAQR